MHGGGQGAVVVLALCCTVLGKKFVNNVMDQPIPSSKSYS